MSVMTSRAVSKSTKRRPRKSWMGTVENDLNQTGVPK